MGIQVSGSRWVAVGGSASTAGHREGRQRPPIGTATEAAHTASWLTRLRPLHQARQASLLHRGIVRPAVAARQKNCGTVIAQHSVAPKRSPVPAGSCSHPPPQPLPATNPLPVSVDVPVLDVSQRWAHTPRGLCVASLAERRVFEVRPRRGESRRLPPFRGAERRSGAWMDHTLSTSHLLDTGLIPVFRLLSDAAEYRVQGFRWTQVFVLPGGGKTSGVEWPGQTGLHDGLSGTARLFPQWLPHPTLPPARLRGPAPPHVTSTCHSARSPPSGHLHFPGIQPLSGSWNAKCSPVDWTLGAAVKPSTFDQRGAF